MTHPTASDRRNKPVEPALLLRFFQTRVVVWLHFFMGGFLFAAWGVEIPNAKAHYGITEADLGLMLLGVGFGSLFALSIAGRVISRWGASQVLLCTQAFAALVMIFALAFSSLWGLMAVLMLFGFSGSMADVAINAEAAELELRSRRVLMSSCHGMFSLGGMVGAGFGALMLGWQVAPQWHLVVACGLVIATVCISYAWKPRDFGRGEQQGQAQHNIRQRMVFSRTVLMLGFLAALGFLAEGAMYDWSTLYMHQELGSPEAQAALAYAFFSAAMAAGRFIGDRLRTRFAALPLLRACALLVAFAMVLMLLTGEPVVALVCFALVGAGLANVVPILFSAAIKVPNVSPARVIAAVSAVGYVGLMGGPALIGFIAHAGTLTLAMFVVVVCALAQAIFARQALGSGGPRGQEDNAHGI